MNTLQAHNDCLAGSKVASDISASDRRIGRSFLDFSLYDDALALERRADTLDFSSAFSDWPRTPRRL